MKDAVDTLLTMQNPGGGFASYERIRGPAWLEWLNHAEVFGPYLRRVQASPVQNSRRVADELSGDPPIAGDIMIEYNYPECTTSVLSALEVFSNKFPDYRRKEIRSVQLRAVRSLFQSADPALHLLQHDDQERHQVHPLVPTR